MLSLRQLISDEREQRVDPDRAGRSERDQGAKDPQQTPEAGGSRASRAAERRAEPRPRPARECDCERAEKQRDRNRHPGMQELVLA